MSDPAPQKGGPSGLGGLSDTDHQDITMAASASDKGDRELGGDGILSEAPLGSLSDPVYRARVEGKMKRKLDLRCSLFFVSTFGICRLVVGSPDCTFTAVQRLTFHLQSTS